MNEFNQIEFDKCKQDFLYFLYNYVYISSIDGPVKFNKDNKILDIIPILFKYKKVIGKIPRQLGKTSLMAIFIHWYSIFYSNTNNIFIGYKQDWTNSFLKRIVFINDNLPEWLKININIENNRLAYSNGSTLNIYYDILNLKGLSFDTLCIDDYTHIKNIDKLLGCINDNIKYILLIDNVDSNIDLQEIFFKYNYTN